MISTFGEVFEVDPKIKIAKNSDVPFIEMADIEPWARTVGSKRTKKFAGGSKFLDGDVLVARITPSLENGKTSIYRASKSAKSAPAGGSTEFIVVRGIAGRSLSEFAYYLLRTADLRSHLIANMNGSSGRQRVQADALRNYVVDLPSIDEQRRIAGVLGALDDKIESNQAVITRAEQLIDEIAVQRATDLPMVALSEVCSLSKSTWKPETSPDQTVQLFSLPAFDEGATPEQAAVASIKSNKTLMDRPGILVSRLNPRISRMWWVETDAARVNVCSPEFAYLTAGDMHGLACTWLAVRSPEFRGEMVDRVTGTSGSHQRVRPADLMTIGVPDYRSLAEHIQATVLTLLHLVSDRRRQSVALAELRDVLLPELMSGRMRVDEAGCLVSEALDEEVRSV
ncbi:MAG: restriction endonuclease subunit S [Actinomyces graevenitzii]|jgi:type I restriction/modification system specificity determinant hsdS (S protein)|uniref:Restriction endonuclease subunit S n=1 Tax=Actinomyces graevenitzii TaxID=55565 RepID=A0A9E7AEJ3_9ACTO|nr:restriction endonuclease subunit S [Actinomyces graevenitzii]UQF79190.1 MAG: restriction endonuclease subunit S [Actinomyces graevenitzii]